MAPRPKLKYTGLGTSILARAYRGDVAELRHRLDRVYDAILEKKSGFKTVVAQTLREFQTQAGISTNLSTQVTLTSGTKVLAPAVTGTYVNGYTFTIVNGVITAIVAS